MDITLLGHPSQPHSLSQANLLSLILCIKAYLHMFQAAGSPGSCGLRPVLWAETPGHWYSLEQNVQRSGCFFSQDFLGSVQMG